MVRLYVTEKIIDRSRADDLQHLLNFFLGISDIGNQYNFFRVYFSVNFSEGLDEMSAAESLGDINTLEKLAIFGSGHEVGFFFKIGDLDFGDPSVFITGLIDESRL